MKISVQIRPIRLASNIFGKINFITIEISAVLIFQSQSAVKNFFLKELT